MTKKRKELMLTVLSGDFTVAVTRWHDEGYPLRTQTYTISFGEGLNREYKFEKEEILSLSNLLKEITK
jgi:hypothetical protein